MAEVPVDKEELARTLKPWLGPASIEGLAPMSGGASREIWAFDAVGPDGSRTELVLRRDPPGRPGDPGAIDREARAISLAAAEGLCVPELIMVSDGEYTQARRVLVGQLAEFAAGLHSLDAPADFPGTDPVADLRATLETFEEYSPVFDLALQELAASQPPQRGPGLVHGDLRLGNVVVGPEGLRAVLDWELAHAGNPAEDLGWLCVKAWRFGTAAPVAGVGTREELLAAYRAAGGAEISMDELRWWEVLGTLRWGVICMTQAHAHLSGAHRSVELAAIGRRVPHGAPDPAAPRSPRRRRTGGRQRANCSTLCGASSPIRSCQRPAVRSLSMPGSPPTCSASSPGNSSSARCRRQPASPTASPPGSPWPIRVILGPNHTHRVTLVAGGASQDRAGQRRRSAAAPCWLPRI